MIKSDTLHEGLKGVHSRVLKTVHPKRAIFTRWCLRASVEDREYKLKEKAGKNVTIHYIFQ